MSATKIVFIGNCQAGALCNILNLNKNLFDINVISIHLPSYNQEIAIDLIKNADIIIAQRIREPYGAASTISMINNKNQNAKIILYNSCYMKLYYFDTNYWIKNKQSIAFPSPYHYNCIIDSHRHSLSVEDCFNRYIDNELLYNKDQLLSIFHNDIEQLKIRYQNILDITDNQKHVYTIDIVSFIKNNYNKHLLFYSFNHPTNILLKYIATQIIEILDINNTIDDSKPQLGAQRCILFKCLSNILDFNLDAYPPLLKNSHDIKNIINQYYAAYNQIL